ncbi:MULTISPECIES: DUF4347 domain-containing protein [unclassified Paraburkholderia]|uniref:DUF4347 domain-containing protein n=1 Tax=unclassified Paraburkholderia TaxID=2615204 RepID=UPI002AB155BE|nr:MULTISPECIES: DUF4347 domain-containing protein [unclassified Paraburkholderia]
MKKIVKQILARWNTSAVVRTPRTAAAPLMLALEPRVVYDASVAAAAPAAHTHEAAHEHAHEGAHRSQAETHPATTNTTSTATGDASSSSSSSQASSAKPAKTASGTTDGTNNSATSSTASSATATTDTTQAATVTALEAAVTTRDTSGAHQVVFVDPGVANYQSLLTGLPTGTQVVILDANSDGFAQIAQYLQTHSGVSAIHLISHGADGEIQAGSAWLNLGDLSQYSAELSAIGAAMKPGGDFLIYGCDVAQDASGQALVQQIAALTHLNVAASTDPTGASALGGDWTLEYQVGDVHTDVIVSAAAERQYDGLLAQSVENFNVSFDTNSSVTSFTLDGITYTTNVAVETAVSTDPYMQALSAASANSGALIIDTQGVGGVNSVTISLAGGKHINLETLDIDVLADANVTITADGNTADAIVINSNDLYTAEEISFAGHSSFANASTITITGGNMVLNLGRMVYSDPAPVLTNTTNATTNYTAGSGATVIDNTVTVTDANGLAPQTATVTISSGAQNSDVLSFSNTNASLYGNLSGTYNSSTHVLTLSSSGNTATLAQWQAALDAVTFSSSTGATAGNRTVTYAVNDGYANSNTVTHTVALTEVFSLTSGSGSTTFVQADNATSMPVTVDSGITISDPFSSTAHSATVSITSGYDATGDVLSFTTSASTGDIAGSYSAGVLTLTSASGNATIAQWQAALQSVQYTDTSAYASGSRTISFSMNDGTHTSTTSTHTVTVQHTDQTPLLADSGGSTSYVAGGSAVTLDGALTLSDADNTTLASATIRIASGYTSGDILLFTANASSFGNISAAYTGGVLTLSSAGATATLAQWQAALDSIGFSSSTSTTSSTRDVTFSISDGTKSSALLHRTVAVTAGPSIVLDSGSAAFVAGDNVASTPVSIDSGLILSDAASTTLSSATVALTGNFHAGEDVLSFTNDGSTMGNIVASYNAATGVLTLSSTGASATLAQWQAALRSVTYTDVAVTPNSATRTVSFQINDGSQSSPTATRTVTVTDTDQTPLLSDSGGSTSYVAGASATAIDSGLSVSDLDNTTLSTATISISSGFVNGDALSYVNTGSFGNIVGVYNAGTGVLTLSSSGATATLAQWQAALDAVSFSTASGASGGTRTVSFSVNDGVKSSAALTHDVVVASGPMVTTDSGSASFVAGDNSASTPVTIDSGLTLSDALSSTLASATVSITGNFQAGEDVLWFTNDGSTMGNIAASYNAATGVLTLSSNGASATLAQWQSALSSVMYTDTAVTPNPATRTVSFQINDGSLSSPVATRTVTVTDTDQTPVLSGSGANVTFTAADNTTSTPVTLASDLTLSDLDNTTLASASVSIVGNFQNSDILSFTNTNTSLFGNIVASYNAGTGVLTLTSSGAVATLAQWSNALESITYTSSAVTPVASTRTVAFTVSDGTKSSTAYTVGVQVSDTDQTPLIGGSNGSVTFTQADNATSTPVTIDSGITLSDRDNSTLASATVSIGNFDNQGDVIGFVNDGSSMGNIVGVYDAGTGVLTLSSNGATATLAQWQSALRSLTFTDTAVTPSSATRTISFVVSDGTKTSTAWTRDVSVVGTDQTPLLAASSGSTTFTAGDNTASTPVAIDTGITLSDLDSPTMSSATVAISGNFHAGEDVLALGAGSFGDISGSYDAATGVLTLSSAGASTLAQWQAALRSVTYTDTAITPDAADRTIAFSVNDGTKNSVTVTKIVSVVDTDQTPVLTGTQSGISYLQGTSAQNIDSGMTLSDRDSLTTPSLPMTITVDFASGFQSGDTLTLNYNAATMGTGLSVTFNTANGELVITASGGKTMAQWDAILDGIQFSTTTSVTAGTRTLTITANDGTKTSTALGYTIDVRSSAPVLTSTGSVGATFVGGDNAAGANVTVDSGLTLTDPLGNVVQSATVAITGNLHSAEDVLGFIADSSNGTTGNIAGSYDSATGVLTLTSAGGTATLAQWQAALRSVYFADTASVPNSDTRTISFSVSDGTQSSATIARAVSVTATHQTLIVSAGDGSPLTYTASAKAPALDIGTGITLTDLNATPPTSASIAFSGTFDAQHDLLIFTSSAATGDITGSYDAATGVLKLTSASGTATLAQWQAALNSIGYRDTQAERHDSTRTIAFTVSDANSTSAAATRTVQIAGVADPVGTPILPQPPVVRPPVTPSFAPPPVSTPFANPLIANDDSGHNDGVSNPLIVLDSLAPVADVGTLVVPASHTFTVDGVHGRSLGDTHVDALDSLLPADARDATDSAQWLPVLQVQVLTHADGAFALSLMSMTANHGMRMIDASATNAAITQADGAPLPAWLHYDAQSGELSGVPPKGVHEVRVMVSVRDAFGHVTRREVVVSLDAGNNGHSAHDARADKAAPSHKSPGAKPAPHASLAKPSLAAQFASAHAALHVAHPLAAQTAAHDAQPTASGQHA